MEHEPFVQLCIQKLDAMDPVGVITAMEQRTTHGRCLSNGKLCWSWYSKDISGLWEDLLTGTLGSTETTTDMIQLHQHGQAPHNVTQSWAFHSCPTSHHFPNHPATHPPGGPNSCLFLPPMDGLSLLPTAPSPFLFSISLLHFSASSHLEISFYQFMHWAQTTSLQVSHLCPVSLLRPMKPKWRINFQHSPRHARSLGMQHRAQTCFLCLFPERGPGDTGRLVLSLGQCQACGTDRIYSTSWPRPRGHMSPSTHGPVTRLHVVAATASKDPHRSILQQESQDFVTNSVVFGYFSRLPNFFRIGNPYPVVLTNTIKQP